jgi:hypothetical protein
MTHTDEVVEKLQREARQETRKHCEEAYGTLLNREVIDATVEYWGKRTNILIASTFATAQSAKVAEVRGHAKGLKKDRFTWDYKEGDGEYKDGYNQAIDDILSILSPTPTEVTSEHK